MNRRLICCIALSFSAGAFAQNAGANKHEPNRPRQEEVQFKNGNINLVGTIIIPPGKGPFPGIVIVHGSGSSSRTNPWTAAYAEALSERGVAVLHPDKRGSGRSGGDWRKANFLDLADDAVAAVELLSQNDKVDPNNVGVIGFSQGGHIIPAAAARSPHIAYVIDVSGAVVPIREQVEDEVLLMAEREGLSPDQMAKIRQLHELSIKFIDSPAEWSAYADALRQAKSGPLRGKKVVEGFPTDRNSTVWQAARTIGNYDPIDYWRQLQVPVVFVYGGKDTNVRVSKSVARIQDVLAPTGMNYSLLLFSKNGHALFRDDELDFLANWIKAKGAP